MVKAVIFDMDGTLIDSEKIKENGWKYAGNCLEIPIDESILSNIRGTNRKFIEKFLLQQFKGSFDFQELYKLREAFISDYIEKNGLKMKQGAQEILDYLKKNHYKIALASSSKMRTIEEYLNKLEILNYFDVIIGGDMVEEGKPSPEIYLKTARLLNVPIENCVGVEDSINGVLAVHRAGMKVVMIPDLEQPTKEIINKLYAKLNSLTELEDILEKIGTE